MDRRYREVKREAESFLLTNQIEDYEIDVSHKHPQLKIKHNGSWHTIVCSSSPSTKRSALYTRRSIKRTIEGLR